MKEGEETLNKPPTLLSGHGESSAICISAQGNPELINNGLEDEFDEDLEFPPFPSGKPRGRVTPPTSAAKPAPKPKPK